MVSRPAAEATLSRYLLPRSSMEGSTARAAYTCETSSTANTCSQTVVGVPPAGEDAGVGAEQVDPAVRGQGPLDERRDGGLVGDVGGVGCPADLLCHPVDGRAVAVADHDGRGALGGEAPASAASAPCRVPPPACEW